MALLLACSRAWRSPYIRSSSIAHQHRPLRPKISSPPSLGRERASNERRRIRDILGGMDRSCGGERDGARAAVGGDSGSCRDGGKSEDDGIENATFTLDEDDFFFAVFSLIEYC